MAVATRIKFCGITRPEDAIAAADAGAWAIGFILWPGSPRYVDPAEAAAIARVVRRKVRVAGVFVDQPLDEVVQITQQVGLDLVQLQLALAQGATLAQLGLTPATVPAPRGHAIQWRINAETLDAEGQARPAHGSLQRFDLPAGPGVRVDTHGRAGATPSPSSASPAADP